MVAVEAMEANANEQIQYFASPFFFLVTSFRTLNHHVDPYARVPHIQGDSGGLLSPPTRFAKVKIQYANMFFFPPIRYNECRQLYDTIGEMKSEKNEHEFEILQFARKQQAPSSWIQAM